VKKKFEISRAIIESASECLNHTACLSRPGTMCKAEKHEDAKVMFVKSRGHQNCPFNIPLGADCICTCPVRVEIYRKYRV
jgi:hypothetical protein